MDITGYLALKEKHSAEKLRMKRRYDLISNSRGAVAVAFAVALYYQINKSDPLLIVALVMLVAGFIILMRIHDTIARQIEMATTLIAINEEELDYLQGKAIPFANGAEFIDHAHAYSYDLDLFGNASLFQNLDRTATVMGKHALAEKLLTLLSPAHILKDQEAIKELAGRVEFRQDVSALSRIATDNKEIHQDLVRWAQIPGDPIPGWVNFISIASPVLLIGALIIFGITGQELYLKLAGGLFLFNLAVFSSQLKRIKSEMARSDRMHRTIRNYALIMARIEKEDLRSPRAREMKEALSHATGSASAQVEKLSALFSKMDGMHSGLGAILFNGTLFFHVHNLRALLKWKKEFARHVPSWLDVIGRSEALNSMANFAGNNPGFAYPRLNDRYQIRLKEAGHPLIAERKRVTNDIAFDDHRFVILSGSNMAGKSTFLRTLGVNMVLAGTGAPICASEASIHPMNVLVSMRSSDSLSDGESYFFAEVKRLRTIMDRLNNEVCFVLLDEILRGTNSDDKRSGTIQVIGKIIERQAIGAIATHDLEVCSVTNDHPGILANKCFEVQVVNDELHFDYTLRDGISQNKSATFLMKKMGII